MRRVRSAVVLIEDGRVALIERVRAGRVYYLFPGGSVEPGEGPLDAAAREAREELGLGVRVGSLVAVVEFLGEEQWYYLADVSGGEFGTGAGEEMASVAESPSGSYTALWVPLAQLAALDVRPRVLAGLVAAGGLAGLREPLRITEIVGGPVGGG